MSRIRHSRAIIGLALAAVAMACGLIGSAAGASAPASAPVAAAAPTPSAPGAPARAAAPVLSAPAPTAPAPTPTAHRPSAPVVSAPPPTPTPTTPAATPTAPDTRDTAQITILGIKATNEDTPFVAPALQPISRELARSSFNSFREAVSDRKVIAVQGETTLPMVEGYALRVHVEKDTGEAVQMVLSWLRTDTGPDGRAQTRVLQRIQITIRKGKYFLSGGWQLQDGALWAAVSAQ